MAQERTAVGFPAFFSAMPRSPGSGMRPGVATVVRVYPGTGILLPCLSCVGRVLCFCPAVSAVPFSFARYDEKPGKRHVGHAADSLGCLTSRTPSLSAPGRLCRNFPVRRTATQFAPNADEHAGLPVPLR